VSTRLLCVLLLSASVLFCSTGLAQEAKKFHIGLLRADVPEDFVEAFRQGMRELGYVDGKDFVLEQRYADGQFDRLPEFAAELVRLKPDVIVTSSTPAMLAAKRATTSIPIVVAASGDPVASGAVAALSHPGGNITGLTIMTEELAMKRLELLKETVPRISHVGVLWNASNPIWAGVMRRIKETAPRIGLRPEIVKMNRPDELEKALAQVEKSHSDALLVLEDAALRGKANRIIEFAGKAQLPAIYGEKHWVSAGGMMSYGPNFAEMFRRAALYVDKILKGAKPGDLPVEQPTKFELVVNLKTAKALGITIPESILLRADEVIR
jgi:putative ABC transport system substrate-binding protein